MKHENNVANSGGSVTVSGSGFINTVAKIISSLFYTGYFPFASGTAGSFAVAVILLLLPTYGTGFFLAVIAVVFFIGVWSASVCEDIWGIDNRRIVVDEALGMLVSVVFVPLNIINVAAAFFLFRFFDITKPPPARQAESLPKGWGVMTDDLIAGVYANITLQIVLKVIEII